MSSTFANDGRFKLGLFSPNLSSALAATTLPERWDGSWENNLALAKTADAAGIDFILPVARYRGYGGATDFQNATLDPITLAAGLLAETENIVVFSTIHTAFTHPLVAAKQLATLDKIGRGRAGLNVVAGWNQPEYQMFGIDLPLDHDVRYGLAQEWYDAVRTLLLSPDPVDLLGEHYQLTGARISPTVDQLIPVLNAGSSDQGRDFGARNADFVFTVVSGPDDGAEVVSAFENAASTKYARKAGVLTTTHVVCRPRREDAENYLASYSEQNADWEAVDNLMASVGMTSKSFTPEQLATFRPRFAAGFGTCPLIGTPDDIADEIERFYQAGFSGLTLSFVDFDNELQYFAAEVLPRLERRGIWSPRGHRSGAA